MSTFSLRFLRQGLISLLAVGFLAATFFLEGAQAGALEELLPVKAVILGSKVRTLPIVINPGTSDEKKLNPPWVALRARVYNKSQEAISLTVMKVGVYSTFGGRSKEGVWEFDLSGLVIPPGEDIRVPDQFVTELPLPATAYQLIVLIKYITESGEETGIAKTLIVSRG